MTTTIFATGVSSLLPRGRLQPEVAEVVGKVLGDWSLEQAAIHIEYALSKSAINDLKRGKVGREVTVRTFADRFWKRFCEVYGSEISAAHGTCDRETAGEWFLTVCYGSRYNLRPAAPELTYESEEEPEISALGGDLRDLPEDVRRHLLESWRRDLTLARKLRGVD
jgi:hypothetical protein